MPVPVSPQQQQQQQQQQQHMLPFGYAHHQNPNHGHAPIPSNPQNISSCDAELQNIFINGTPQTPQNNRIINHNNRCQSVPVSHNGATGHFQPLTPQLHRSNGGGEEQHTLNAKRNLNFMLSQRWHSTHKQHPEPKIYESTASSFTTYTPEHVQSTTTTTTTTTTT